MWSRALLLSLLRNISAMPVNEYASGILNNSVMYYRSHNYGSLGANVVGISLGRVAIRIDAAYCNRRGGVVCPSVCLSVTIVSASKTAEPICRLRYGVGWAPGKYTLGLCIGYNMVYSWLCECNDPEFNCRPCCNLLIWWPLTRWRSTPKHIIVQTSSNNPWN